MTVADKLTLLEQTKEAQRVKLRLPKNLPFSRYHEFFEYKFDPRYLFLNGEQGVWYDPSDKSTLFQDVAGTVPVTKDGDPVALMRDKSGNGNHAVQSVSTSRPVYKTDGVLHWLQFDGVDDSFSTDVFAFNSGFTTVSTAVKVVNKAVLGIVAEYTNSSELVSNNNIRFSLQAPPYNQTSFCYISYSVQARYLLKSTETTFPTTRAMVATHDRYKGVAKLLVSGKPQVEQEESGYSSVLSPDKLHIGSRQGTAWFFRGSMYGLVVSDAESDALELMQYMESKSGVTL